MNKPGLNWEDSQVWKIGWECGNSSTTTSRHQNNWSILSQRNLNLSQIISPFIPSLPLKLSKNLLKCLLESSRCQSEGSPVSLNWSMKNNTKNWYRFWKVSIPIKKPQLRQSRPCETVSLLLSSRFRNIGSHHGGQFQKHKKIAPKNVRPHFHSHPKSSNKTQQIALRQQGGSPPQNIQHNAGYALIIRHQRWLHAENILNGHRIIQNINGTIWPPLVQITWLLLLKWLRQVMMILSYYDVILMKILFPSLIFWVVSSGLICCVPFSSSIHSFKDAYRWKPRWISSSSTGTPPSPPSCLVARCYRCPRLPPPRPPSPPSSWPWWPIWSPQKPPSSSIQFWSCRNPCPWSCPSSSFHPPWSASLFAPTYITKLPAPYPPSWPQN